MRIVSFYIFLPFIYFLVVILSLYLTKVIVNKYSKYTYGFIVFLTFFLLVGITYFHCIIDPYSLRIDRWSAINNFLQNLFRGVYPYTANTHLGGYGSPFPVWQFFHIPFYLLGNVGFGMTFSLLTLVIVLIRFTKDNKANLFYILLLALSPAFWYEVVGRSDLLYNFILLFVCLLFIRRHQLLIYKNALFLGIMCGLFLSTRISVVVLLFIYFFPDFIRSDIKSKLLFILSIILTFTLSFFPFIFWNFNALFFFKYNPFVLQYRQGTAIVLFIILSLSVYFGVKWKNNFLRFNLYSAFILLTLVGTTFLYNMINTNFTYSIFSDSYDITYFNMALPFIIFGISFYNNTSFMRIEQ